jgi:Flp pilus assembly protein TadD
MLAVLLLVSSDYGITWDEKMQQEYGQNLLKFYLSGGRDTSYLSGLPTMPLLGGFVEVVAAAATRISSADVYNTRHLVLAFFGFLGILFTGLTAKELAGWPTGLLALLFMFFTPVIFAHSLYNSKDIPFASAHIMALYFLIRFLGELPGPRRSTCIWLIAAISMAINIRVGGLLLIAYLLFFYAVHVALIVVTESDVSLTRVREFRQSALYPPAMAITAYFGGLVFWPYGLTHPLRHPLEALRVLGRFEVFDSFSLFSGRWIHRWETPWYYIPLWIWITVPLFINVIVFIIPFFLTKRLGSAVGLKREYYAVVCFTFVFPLCSIALWQSNVYDGWRHAFFVYPSVVVAAAVAWTGLVRLLPGGLKAAAATLLALFMLEPASWMVRHHPFQSFYFSPVIGGIGGAFRRYEIDMYGTSLRSAVEWIAGRKGMAGGSDRPGRVRCGYGEVESTAHFVKKYPHLRYVVADEESLDWDYSIVLPTQAKRDPLLLRNWPPAGTVHEEQIDGTPLWAVVENFRTPETIRARLRRAVHTAIDVAELLDSSTQLCRMGDFAGCIAASERALLLGPPDALVYENMASALIALGLYREAAEASRKALEIDPSFEGARRSHEVAQARASLPDAPAHLADRYLDLSFVYYDIGQYERCIAHSQTALRYRPGDAVAYNNICSCYNGLEDYGKAAEACRRALRANPGFELARNNLDIAEKNLRAKP